MSEEQNYVITLTHEQGEVRAVLLSKPTLDGHQLGNDAGFTLTSALFGYNRVELYEAVSGTDRYPPGRIAKITLSFEELDRLIIEYQQHRAEIEAEKQQAKAQQVTNQDEYDPFFDSDALP